MPNSSGQLRPSENVERMILLNLITIILRRKSKRQQEAWYRAVISVPPPYGNDVSISLATPLSDIDAIPIMAMAIATATITNVKQYDDRNVLRC